VVEDNYPSLCQCGRPALPYLVIKGEGRFVYGACSMKHQDEINKGELVRNIARVSDAGVDYALTNLKDTFYEIIKREKTGQMNQWSRESKLAFVKDAVRHFLNHQNHVAETGELKPKENEIKSIL
jgi:L-arabinose isomerase